MNRLVKVLGIAAVIAVIAVMALILAVEIQSRRSLRDLEKTMAQFTPGTPFHAVTNQLGSPVRSHTDVQEMMVFGSRKDESFVTNSTLHLFMHRGRPYRWILLYTDKNLQTVRHAGWRHM